MERTHFTERFKRVTAATSAVGLTALILTGCASATPNSEPQPQPTPGELNTMSVEYREDGSRLITFAGNGYGPVLGRCDGNDLFEQTQDYSTYASNAIARSVNHPACDDGKLTPEDFPANPQTAQPK